MMFTRSFTTPRGLKTLLIGLGLTLIAAGLLPLTLPTGAALAQDAAEATPAPEPVTTPETGAAMSETEAAALAAAANPIYPITGDVPTPTGNNSYCQLCHNQEWRTQILSDGSVLNLYVPPEQITGSVHGTRSDAGPLGCLDCHGANAFPHNQPPAPDSRTHTLDAVTMCVNCHQDQVPDVETGLHAEAIRAGETTAAVCTDCHGAHNVQPVAAAPNLVAGVCGDCHEPTYEQWRVSAHADIGPLGCGACHSPHSQRPRVVGDEPDALCLNCHDEDQMPNDIFVHVQHQNSDYDLNCTSCHMVTVTTPDAPAVRVSDPVSEPHDGLIGHSMIVETVTCNTCHQQLVASGEWTQLVADREPVGSPVGETASDSAADETEAAAIAEGQEAAGTPEGDLEAAQSVPENFVPLLQGLILGLGLGATVAAVFVARGNRAKP